MPRFGGFVQCDSRVGARRPRRGRFSAADKETGKSKTATATKGGGVGAEGRVEVVGGVRGAPDADLHHPGSVQQPLLSRAADTTHGHHPAPSGVPLVQIGSTMCGVPAHRHGSDAAAQMVSQCASMLRESSGSYGGLVATSSSMRPRVERRRTRRHVVRRRQQRHELRSDPLRAEPRAGGGCAKPAVSRCCACCRASSTAPTPLEVASAAAASSGWWAASW